MKITAITLLFALSASASPVLNKRQVASVTSQVASAASSIAAVPGSAASSASASAAAPSASASQDFATGLLAALRERQANTLASLVEPLAGTLGPVLSQGDWTIFAPGDEYLAGVNTSDQAALTQILSYHLVAGDYPAAGLPENASTIAPTFLDAQYLGANNTKLPIAFTKDVFGTTRIRNQNISVIANSTYNGNIIIKLIDGVLTLPTLLPETIATAGASSLVGALSALLPDVVQTLNTTQGATVFAPDNAAIDAAVSTLTPLAQSNPQAVAGVVQGHVIPSVVFSSNITDGLTVTSLGGTPLTFISNATGAFVTGNGVTAQITSPDNIASNGVVHLIDALLFSAPAPAASSASGAAGGVASQASASASSVVGSATALAGSVTALASSAVAAATSA